MVLIMIGTPPSSDCIASKTICCRVALKGKANGIIEICQEIILELCSIKEWVDFTWRVSDSEELVGKNYTGNNVGCSFQIASSKLASLRKLTNTSGIKSGTKTGNLGASSKFDSRSVSRW